MSDEVETVDAQKRFSQWWDNEKMRIAEMKAQAEHEIAVQKDELSKKIASAEQEIAQSRSEAENEIAQARSAWEAEKSRQAAETEERMKAEKDALQKAREEMDAKSAEMAQKMAELDAEKQQTARVQDVYERHQRSFEEEVAMKAAEVAAQKMQSLEEAKQQAENECGRLRDEIRKQTEYIAAYEDLKRRLGDEEPERVLVKIKAQEERLTSLQQELAARPAMDIQAAMDELRAQVAQRDERITRLQDENTQLKRDNNEVQSLRKELAQVKNDLASVTCKYDAAEARANYSEAEVAKLREEAEQLKNTYEMEAEQEKRGEYIRALRYNTYDVPQVRDDEHIDEKEWLKQVSGKIQEAGFKFPRRLVYAFHTALKTADMSIITVLAGVSGTGKSELPKLYSHFGGINFISVPVEPNWDSKESMLGFFNTINNKFDAQPLLEFLVQAQADMDDNCGLCDALNMVLLDEMNLAHVELYFADFLSKLEERRDGSIPYIPIKVGSGMKDVPLKLGSNVLWVGTMNQDETTKALSDKVLDRGIIINFPRPVEFKRRNMAAASALGQKPPLLMKRHWDEWIAKELLEDAEIAPYKKAVEEINNRIASVGRSLGHRVWQSIECYMANYPLVMGEQDENMRKKQLGIAFEDCMVQKVMPKLRGIDTEGEQSKCLDDIHSILESTGSGILGDYDNAMKYGSGQFIWNSSDYLNAEEGKQHEKR